METIQKLESQIDQIAGAIMSKEDEIKTLEQQADFLKALIEMVKSYNQLVKRSYIKTN